MGGLSATSLPSTGTKLAASSSVGCCARYSDANSISRKARLRMVSSFDLENTIPDWALCFRWNIVLRGREATPLDTDKH